MKIIGITGGIGAGKSTMLDYINCNYNAYCIVVDIIRAMAIRPGGKAYKEILDNFGIDILDKNFLIDNKKLIEVVFSSKSNLTKYNNIVNSVIKNKVLEILGVLKEYGMYDIILIESAILFEQDLAECCDEIWYVHTDILDRKQRLLKRGDFTEDIISNIISYQKMPSEFKRLCNRTIDNNGNINSLFTEIDTIIK